MRKTKTERPRRQEKEKKKTRNKEKELAGTTGRPTRDERSETKKD